MKKTTIVLFLFLFAFTSCENNSQKVDISENIKLSVKKIFEDAAFKENGTVEFFDFDFVDYSKVSKNDLDSYRLALIGNESQNLQKRINILLQQAKANEKLAIQMGVLGQRDLLENYKEDALKSINESIALNDTLKVNVKLDSTIREKIKANQDAPKDFYRATIFVKATTNIRGENQNFLDTIRPFLNKDFRVLELNKYN